MGRKMHLEGWSQYVKAHWHNRDNSHCSAEYEMSICNMRWRLLACLFGNTASIADSIASEQMHQLFVTPVPSACMSVC